MTDKGITMRNGRTKTPQDQVAPLLPQVQQQQEQQDINPQQQQQQQHTRLDRYFHNHN